MPGNFVMVHTCDQWLRSAFQDAAIEVESGAVQLSWETTSAETGLKTPTPAGLTFDPWCGVYRSIPEEDRVVAMRYSDSGPESGTEQDLFGETGSVFGAFMPEKEADKPFDNPGTLAADNRGRLFILESKRKRIVVFDLLYKRILRRIHFEKNVLDLAGLGDTVCALLDDPPALASLNSRGVLRVQEILPRKKKPCRLAVSIHKRAWVLYRAGEEEAEAVPLERPEEGLRVPFATDLEFAEEEILVLARKPGQNFHRYRVRPGECYRLPPMRARNYDGRGIARIPEGGIGFWTDDGFGRATLAPIRYVKEGKVTGFRLDSGRFQTIWGRMFIDACIPEGTSVSARCLALDDVPEGVEEVFRSCPENVVSLTIRRPDLSPPMPPKDLLEAARKSSRLHRRETGAEVPWSGASNENGYATFEGQVLAGAGRYLWVALELKGTTRLTPKVKSIRVEYPSHDLLRRLPRLFSQDDNEADFLRRYLGIMEGAMREIDLRAVYRHVLLDPETTPQEALPWLAGFIGLALDDRWPLTARRTLIANGVWLFRFRGTVGGLKRFIEIYLDRSVVIIEHFKVRGLGGAIVGEGGAPASRAVVGRGFRVGGKVGDPDAAPISEESIEDAFDTHAHRFSVVLPVALEREKLAVIEHILAIHRPCHTMYDICTVDAGMRTGIALYVGMTSMVGRTSGFGTLRAGGSLLGRGDILGRPADASRAGGKKVRNDI